MKNSTFKIYITIILVSLIGNNILGSENLEKDSFDSSTYWKLAAAGTICIGGYCVYQLWQENKDLREQNIRLTENLNSTQASNAALNKDQEFWRSQATQEKKDRAHLQQLLEAESRNHQLTHQTLDQMIEKMDGVKYISFSSDSD